MAYDYVAESRRLIEDGLPDGPVRLSRRHRFAPLAVDVDGDVAAARFLRRGVACYWDDTHLLTRHPEVGWLVLGGGGGSSGGLWSAEEFVAARGSVRPGAVETEGGSSVRDDRGRPPWIRAVGLVAAPEVAAVVVNGSRRIAVPPHGRLVVVWRSLRRPRLSALDAAGHELSSRKISTDLRMPEMYRD